MGDGQVTVTHTVREPSPTGNSTTSPPAYIFERPDGGTRSLPWFLGGLSDSDLDAYYLPAPPPRRLYRHRQRLTVG